MDDSDLSGLDLDSARQYIFAYAVDIKRYDRDIAAARSELDLWTARVKLAEEKGMADLAAAAGAKVELAAGKLRSLEAEQGSLKDKVRRMQSQLPLIRARERSIDPDRLLAELQLMTGELLGEGDGPGRAAVERDFAALEAGAAADTALDALKHKMGSGPAPNKEDESRG